MQQQILTVKVLPGCAANLNDPEIFGIADETGGYPSTLTKFPIKPMVRLQYNMEDNAVLLNGAVNDLKKFTIMSHFSQSAATELYQKHGIKPLVVLFANAFHPGGHGEKMSAQEERVLADSNANYAIPKVYEKGLILTYDGLYIISDALIQNVPVDFAFVAMPNLTGAGVKDNTMSEIAYGKPENRAIYLRHITSLIILQFYVAKFSGNVMVTGRQGCGVFGNNDEDVAAVIHVIAKLPQFVDVKVIYALGKDGIVLNTQNIRNTHKIYNEPLIEKIIEVDECVKKIQQDTGVDLNINAVSQDMRERYCKIVKPELSNKRLESTCIINKVKDSLLQKFNSQQVEIFPFWGESDGLPRYKFQFENQMGAESFSKQIFELGIGAQSNPKNIKSFIKEPDGSYTIVFTKGQFDLLKFNIFSDSAKNNKFNRFSPSEIKKIREYIENLTNSKTKESTIIGQSKLSPTDEKINGLNALLILDEKGYPRNAILAYIETDYPNVANALPNTEMGKFFSELKKAGDLSDYKLFGPTDTRNAKDLKSLIDELNSDKPGNAFLPNSEGKQKLRKICRDAHGHGSGEKETSNIREIMAESPLGRVLRGEDVKISDLGGKSITISGNRIRQYQQDVEIIHNDEITPKNILQIQSIKSGLPSLLEKREELEEKELEYKGKNFLIRGESDQYLDEKGSVLDNTRPRIFYYACFPNLQKGKKDFIEFAGEKVLDGKKIIGINNVDRYKESVKNVLHLMLKIANSHQEAIDIVTPNAFFYGLDEAGQQEAKNIFIDAVLELISMPDFSKSYGNVPAIILHSDPKETEKKIIDRQNQLQVPVILNTGDASSPQNAANNLSLNFRVAEALMGDVLGPAGNGALGDRAEQAKEENDSRKTFHQLVFSSKFNPTIIRKIYELPDANLDEPPKEFPSPFSSSSQEKCIVM